MRLRTGLMWSLAWFIVAARASFAAPASIQYDVTDLGGGRWQYTYEVMNNTLAAPVEEFTIWFEYLLYDSLSVETPDPPATDWDEQVIQPDPFLSDDGFYDALTLGEGIAAGGAVVGSAVSFDWLGVEEPGAQLFEIVDPDSFQTLYSGMTVPEPSTLCLIGAGLVVYRRRHRLKPPPSAALDPAP